VIRNFIFFLLLLIPGFSSGADNLELKADSAWNVKDYQLFLQLTLSEDADEVILKRGKAHQSLEHPVQAIQSYNLVLEKSTDQKLRGEAALNAGEIYYEQKSFKKSIEYYSLALRAFEKTGNAKDALTAQFKTAIIHGKQGEAEMAETLLRKILTRQDLDPMRKALALEELGKVHFSVVEMDSARANLEAANSIYEAYGMQEERLNNIEFILLTYSTEGRSREEITLAKEAADLAVQSGSPSQTVRFLTRLSFHFRKEENFFQALKYLELAREYLDKIPPNQGLPLLYELAELYDAAARDTQALLSFLDASQLAQQVQDQQWLEIIERRKSLFFSSRARYEEAFTALHIADSLNEVNNLIDLRLAKREFGTNEFDTENRVQTLEDLRTIEEIGERNILKNALIIGTVFFTILFILLFREFTQKRKLSKVLEWKVYKRTRELRKANKELNTYIYKSSHDLRTPLTSIKSLLRLLEKEEHNASTKKYLGLILSCTDQMDDILVNLSRAVDYKKVDIKVEQIDFNKLRYQIVEKELANIEGLQMSWNIEESGAFFSDFKLLKVILQQTITNAIAYRKGSHDDYCRVSIHTDHEGATLSIEDNGVGIPEKVRDKVFDMFVKGTHKSTGAGLGLYLVRIAGEKIKAKVKLDTEEDLGSKLTFHLPNLN
jgi:signal transduction histidine kinase